MSAREWKPGDVAMVRLSGYQPEVAVRGGNQWFVAGPRLGSQHGWHDGRIEVVRPLVLIDPEDREAVERLAETYRVVGDWPAVLHVAPWSLPALRMQAALREFANPTPPKPEEPTGLGAVVEDAEGTRYVRVFADPLPWVNAEDDDPYDYADIAAARVLSEGVTP